MSKTDNPLVSIIMPVYNSERHLRESIDSVLRQTYTNFELIIVNDGSVDSSQEIIDHYASIDSRIKAFQQPNAGVVAASNLAASHATGEYINRTDSDDVCFDTKLEDLMNVALKNPKAILVSGNIEVIDEKGEFVYRAPLIPKSADIKRALYFRNPLANGATLIKRSAFEEVGRYSNVFAEDCHLWTKLWSLGAFLGTGTAVYKWRINRKGLTHSNNELSIQKEKEYTSSLWTTPPNVISRAEIIKASRSYLKTHKRDGVYYKETMLDDLGRIGVRMIKAKRYGDGLKQILAVATTGRTGLMIILKRLATITSNSIKNKMHRNKQLPKIL